MRTGAVVVLLLLMAVPVRAADSPPDLKALYEFAPAPGAAIPFAEEKRHSAMRLTALGFGARAGLARRSWEIGVMLERLSAPLSAIYRFGDLMLTEHGFTVLPPVLAETRQAFRLGRGQARAASARLVLRIVEPERIVSAAPHWRDYLVRAWRTPAPPAAVLFPRTGPETTQWRQWLAEGWAHGTALGDDIFAADLDRLNRTFEGVVLWHRLHLADMVSAPGLSTIYTAAAGHESAAADRRDKRAARQAGSIQSRHKGVADDRRWRPAMTVCANHCPGGTPSSFPDSYWPEAAHVFPVERLDAFLLWAAKLGASDISFQTGAPAFIEVDGRLARATGAALDGVALGSLCARIFDATGEGILRGGRAIDCSHAVAEARGVFRRFRCNLAPVQAAGGFAVNITLRVLPGAPPSFEELGIEDEIVEAWDLRRGLTLVTGVPGSGKSTLLAAGTRRLLEHGAGRIQSYEAPIEFVFDHIEGDGALMSSSEIPRHFQSFADGLRSSLRRRPAAVIVGEARDRETVEAVVRAADYGIAVYSTAHTIGVAATIRRLLAEFPAGERAERGAALIDAMNLAVTQVLAPKPAGSDRSTSVRGGRTALREWLVFDDRLKADLLELPQTGWPARIEAALAATGNNLAAAAGRAFAEGRIGPDVHRRYRAAAADGAGYGGNADRVGGCELVARSGGPGTC